jgi:hypothetical protein
MYLPYVSLRHFFCLCIVLQAVVIKDKTTPTHPSISTLFISNVFPDLQQQSQPVQLKFTVDGQDSTPAGKIPLWAGQCTKALYHGCCQAILATVKRGGH